MFQKYCPVALSVDNNKKNLIGHDIIVNKVMSRASTESSTARLSEKITIVVSFQLQ